MSDGTDYLKDKLPDKEDAIKYAGCGALAAGAVGAGAGAGGAILYGFGSSGIVAGSAAAAS